MNIEKTLIEILSSTQDESLGLTANQLGLKATFSDEGSQINLNLEAGFPTKPLEDTLLPSIEKACIQAFQGYQLKINMRQLIRPHRTQFAGKGLRGVKNTIAIASGKGGVGKSTVSVNLAISLARAGARVGLLDADIYGPSIPLMLGQAKPIEMKDEYYLPILAHGIQAMSIGYLTDSEQAIIWRGPMLAKSLIQMVNMTFWDDLDYLFIDLPPGTGDIQLSLVQKIPLTGAVVVTTPQNVATLDAQKAIQMFAKTNIDVLGLVENMSLHLCSNCGHQEAIFGSGGGERLCDSLKVKLLGQIPLDSQIRIQCDEGNPTAAQDSNENFFMKTAMNTAITLAGKPLNYADKFPDIVVE
ncbi:MAG: iron-sulfur cluster carrier protein ApbC [Tatlockia sp.]|nr:iron-sulfur cluster carrier protein ApbC [Tatlockia sp.]